MFWYLDDVQSVPTADLWPPPFVKLMRMVVGGEVLSENSNLMFAWRVQILAYSAIFFRMFDVTTESGSMKDTVSVVPGFHLRLTETASEDISLSCARR